MKFKLICVFVFWFVVATFSYGQRAVSGVVTSAKDNQPIIGAIVLVEKTTIGTTTDVDGKYSIAVPNDSKNLIVSYTGMKTRTVEIIGSTVNVVLGENEKVLDDVIVTALGIKREKKALGYAVQEVNAEDLTKAGNPDALSSLSGKVAGLSVTTASGQPGAAVNLQLRGITSISNDNQPLIVVDGVPIDNSQYNTLSNVGQDPGGNNGGINQNRGTDLNPDDIENVSVLKGPSAAALYGSLASNGVIMITTKRGGKKGSKKWSIDVGTSVTFDKVNKLPELQNTYLQGSKNGYTAGTSRSWGPNKDTMYWDGLGAISNNGYDNHGNIVGKSDPSAKLPFTPYNNTKIFTTGVTTTNSFSINGGSENGSFRLGLSNLYQTGIIPLTDINKTTVTLSGEQKIGKVATISGSASYINSGMDGALSGNNGSAITYGVYRTPISFDNSNGNISNVSDPNIYTNLDGSQRTYFTGGFDNPYFSINNNRYRSDLNRAFGTINVTADPTSWLNLGARMGVDFYSERHQQVLAIGSYTQPSGQIIVDQYFSRILNSDFMGTLHKDLFKNFNASLLLGYNVYSNYGQNSLENGTNLNFPGFSNISDASTIIASESHSKILRYAGYGALNIDWKGQLYINLTDRNEWSSTLPQGSRSYNYPSVSGSWIFTETAKMSTSKWLPYGKIRVSWAEVGKSPSPYLIQRYYGQYTVGNDGWTNGVSFPFNGLNGYANSGTLSNSAIKPEFTKSYEAGLEMRFLTGLKTFGGFGFDITYYNTTTVNGIIPAPIAPSTGFVNFISNNGQIRNQGIELIGTITPVKGDGFTWDLTVNWSKNISKVLSLGAGLNQYAIGGFTSVEAEAIVGKPYGVIYGGDYLRNAQGQVVVDGRQYVGGVANSGYGLPIADPNQKVIGDPNPKWKMGLRNTFSYKGLALSLLFDIKHGGDIYDGTVGALTTYGRAAATAAQRENTAYNAGGVVGIPQANGTTTITNTPNKIAVDMTSIDPNTGKSIAQLWYTGNGGGFGSVSTPFIEDGSYFRLRELSLSYSVPSKLFQKVFIKGLDISFLARNLFLVTKYKGVDPDQSAAGAGNLTGLEWFNLPSTKSYGFSVKLHF